MDVYEAYSRILCSEPLKSLDLSDRQLETIEKFRRYEACEMCHAVISEKTGLRASTIKKMKRVYNNFIDEEKFDISHSRLKSIPINQEGALTII
jgi:hypothetical protein